MGTGSDGFKYALWMLDKKLQGLDARVVHILHDEIIVEARDDIAGQVSGVVKDCMEKTFEQLKIRVPMIAKPLEGDAWS